MKSRKAISPVIATVILVAVAITIAVAVSYWMSGISSSYTKFEKVEIQSTQCVRNGTTSWTVTLSLKNSGSATSTLNGVYVNDQIAALNATTGSLGLIGALRTDVPTAGLTIASGGSDDVVIYIGQGWPVGAFLTSGTTINVKIHSAGGMDYIKLVELV